MKKVILFFVFVALVAAKPAKDGYSVGDIATDFRLKNVDGKMVSMADYTAAKGFIIAFDCNTCPVSRAYNNRIIALSKKYADKGFPLIAINPNSPEESAGDSYDEMVKYAKRKGFTYPYLFDESQQVVRAYGATNTPHIFLLTRSGSELKVAYIGAIDDNTRDETGVSKRYVEDALEALLAGKPITTSRTKAVGCAIKWRDA